MKTAEVYESIEDITGDNDESEKKLLKEFCNVSMNSVLNNCKHFLSLNEYILFSINGTGSDIVFFSFTSYLNIFF